MIPMVEFLENLIIKQLSAPTLFPLNEIDIKKLRPPVVKTQDSKQVQVSIPEDDVINKPSKDTGGFYQNICENPGIACGNR